MKKRFIFYLLLFCIFAGSIILVYQLYKPKEVNIKVNDIVYKIDNKITFEQLEEMLLDQQEVSVIIYRNNDVSSKYLFDTILSSILSAKSLKSFENLYYIDITSLSEQDNGYINKYKVEQFPCLVKYDYKKGEAHIMNKLENVSETAISYENVEKWLIDCQIITAD